MATDQRRARYWARSFAGWHEFAAVQPNRAHYALSEMQRMGWAQSIITQNVDRLHHKAGSRDIIELHGTTHRQVCSQARSAYDVVTAWPTENALARSPCRVLQGLTCVGNMCPLSKSAASCYFHLLAMTAQCASYQRPHKQLCLTNQVSMHKHTS